LRPKVWEITLELQLAFNQIVLFEPNFEPLNLPLAGERLERSAEVERFERFEL
jgi:hypothetical protein